MIAYPMLWPFKLLTHNKNKDILSYPLQKSKTIICHRKHCTEKCVSNESYKFWIRFLMDDKINYQKLYDNLLKIDGYVRYDVYKYILGIKNEEKRLKYKPVVSNDGINKYNAERCNKQIHIDCGLVKRIIFRCKRTKCDEFERIFNLYKLVCDKFYKNGDMREVDELILEIIYKLNNLANSTEIGLYKIIKVLIEKHGLFLFKSEDNENVEKLNKNSEDNKESEINYSIITLDYNNEITDNNNEITANNNEITASNNEITASNSEITANNNEIRISNSEITASNSEITASNNEIDNNNEITANNNEITASNNEFIISKSVVFEVFKIIVFSKNDTFLRMTDMILSLWCTYEDLIRHAAKISLYKNPEQIVSVLNARGNNEYYKELNRTKVNYKELNRTKEKKTKIRSTENYFDFLIIQNETIKAQENIKKQLLKEISDLKNQIKKPHK